MNEAFLQIKAFAKINWTLKIFGKRPDGYHEIDTVLQTVSLHDDLTFSSRNDDQIILHTDAHNLPRDNTNLIVKAAHALRDLAGVGFGADVYLTKRIPAQGGLGGASSNAALTLLALTQVWQLDLQFEQLDAVASRLGSDVPFFLTGGTARATGTGSSIWPLEDTETKHLLIVTPNAKVSTVTAYASLQAP